MTHSSRIPGFYRLPPEDRAHTIGEVADLQTDEVEALQDALSLREADLMIENVIGTFALPLGVGVNFLINDKDTVVPMVVEEPSVVAAVSNMARLVRDAGGFRADADDGLMIGQIQLVNVTDPEATRLRLEAELDSLQQTAHEVHPRLVARGGGIRGMHVRTLHYDEPGEQPENMVVLHFLLDCVDAMGANMVNTIAERLAPRVARITGEKVGLRILSNLASERLARASCTLRPEHLAGSGVDGQEVIRGIASAYRFAWADPWRAATHNKGVMNGIDAVALATGNDWRAIEAGAHAWAARDGQYRSLTTWKVDTDGNLHGRIELPLQVGTVGGTSRQHPTVASNLKILGHPRARELAALMAAVGLAQNLGALKALATEGIQRGHMRMHARSLAAQAGARNDEVPWVVDGLCVDKNFSVEKARELLQIHRSDVHPTTTAEPAESQEK
ncbi:MAG: hydroxymethylglutaryl-CoA reductase, degradative [Myxococcota bacterium]|nr:hydroxymethylglutaryl-CoA reductase, degradative [Myxococcota bacterium]